ncbi:hypothetical protein V2G26_011826 [Clonostachys chloroleuca]
MEASSTQGSSPAVIILTKQALDEADQSSSATRARHPRRDRLGRATERGFFVCSCRPSKTRFFLQADAANSGHLDWGSGHPNGRVQLDSFSFRSRSRKLAMVQGPKLRPIRRVRDHLLAVSRASASIASLGPRVWPPGTSEMTVQFSIPRTSQACIWMALWIALSSASILTILFHV